MRKLVFIISIILLSLSSCQITEKIYFEEDGSGKYNLEINMSEMMKSLNELSDKENNIDSTYVAKDSIMYFSDILKNRKDSIAKLPKEKQKQLIRMKDVKMIIHEDKRKNEFWMSMVGSFKNTKDLENLIDVFNATQSKGKQVLSKANIKYTYKKNKFSRKAIEKEFTTEQQETYDNSMKGFEMFMKGTSYTLEYHFLKPIKKASIKDAKFSEDKKTIYIEKSIGDLIDNPNVFDFEIKLKK